MEHPTDSPATDSPTTLEHHRLEVLEQLQDWLEMPMIVLGFFWLVLLVIELIWGLSPFLQSVSTLIWVLFIIDFALRFVLAPRKLAYLRDNWLGAISLALPALRVFRLARVLRLARATRGLRLVKIVGSLNRGMRTIRATLGRRGFGYVVALTLVITVVGAAGMYALERSEAGLESYGDALWWTAMIMTTLGSDYWPRTAEGRVLCVILSLYSFAVFGYITATLASYFVDRDAESEEAELASARSIKALEEEVRSLRADLRQVLLRP
ncbi:potassium channel family protein [Rhodospirillaceae bacterium SYSU D60014]|uniref:potassium channel family protein n=1 Tax=Virgifigura deserti TaxID=2268457 RepID=UPI000E66A399